MEQAGNYVSTHTLYHIGTYSCTYTNGNRAGGLLTMVHAALDAPGAASAIRSPTAGGSAQLPASALLCIEELNPSSEGLGLGEGEG